jgi:HEAT repeat protein
METFPIIVEALTKALDDYTTDQRGDVGSWIRIAALSALGRIIPLNTHPPSKSDPHMLERVVGGAVRLAVEKLEPVRGEAARTLAALRAGQAHWEGVDALAFESSDAGK